MAIDYGMEESLFRSLMKSSGCKYKSSQNHAGKERFNEIKVLNRFINPHGALMGSSSISDNFSHGTYRNYERLEFLGDAIIHFVAAAVCFSEFKDATEGELTQKRSKITQNSALAAISRVRNCFFFFSKEELSWP
jgi:dsRNA-specific ribonuclease